MRELIKKVSLAYWLIGLLLLLHIGDYSQLLFPLEWHKLRNTLFCNEVYNIPFYHLYWVATILSLCLVLFILVIIVGKLAIIARKRERK